MRTLYLFFFLAFFFAILVTPHMSTVIYYDVNNYTSRFK